MPLLRYFLTVGIALTAALYAASTYLESQAPGMATARVSVAPTTASLYIPPAPSKPVHTMPDDMTSLYVALPASKPSKKTRH